MNEELGLLDQLEVVTQEIEKVRKRAQELLASAQREPKDTDESD